LKLIITTVCSLLFFALPASAVSAADWKEDQAKADQYYETQNFGKAFNLYISLVKIGDSHSQDRVSQMYANGEGTKVNLEEAYAWSVLAAQRGAAEIENKREILLQQTKNKAAAEKRLINS